jgi:hypothetical protein
LLFGDINVFARRVDRHPHIFMNAHNSMVRYEWLYPWLSEHVFDVDGSSCRMNWMRFFRQVRSVRLLLSVGCCSQLRDCFSNKSTVACSEGGNRSNSASITGHPGRLSRWNAILDCPAVSSVVLPQFS